MEHQETKTILQKVGDGRKLTSEEKKILKGFITVLQKALKENLLSDDQRDLVNTTIKKSKAGSVTWRDFITLARQLFGLAHIFKDSS